MVGVPYLAIEQLTGAAHVRPIVLVVILAFYLFRVTHLTLNGEGIRFHRILGSPRFLAWHKIRSVAPASRREVVFRGWLWPLFPAREMSSSLTSLGHFRIQWDNGFCYFPPADSQAFQAFVSHHLAAK